MVQTYCDFLFSKKFSVSCQMDAMWNTGLSPDDCAYAVHKCLLFLPVESYLPLPRASLNRGD